MVAPFLDAEAADFDMAQAAAGRIAGFREDTREQRMSVAREAEHRFEQHADDWLGELRTAMVDVERIRDAGPDLGPPIHPFYEL